MYSSLYNSPFPSLKPDVRYKTAMERAGFDVAYKNKTKSRSSSRAASYDRSKAASPVYLRNTNTNSSIGSSLSPSSAQKAIMDCNTKNNQDSTFFSYHEGDYTKQNQLYDTQSENTIPNISTPLPIKALEKSIIPIIDNVMSMDTSLHDIRKSKHISVESSEPGDVIHDNVSSVYSIPISSLSLEKQSDHGPNPVEKSFMMLTQPSTSDLDTKLDSNKKGNIKETFYSNSSHENYMPPSPDNYTMVRPLNINTDVLEPYDNTTFLNIQDVNYHSNPNSTQISDNLYSSKTILKNENEICPSHVQDDSNRTELYSIPSSQDIYQTTHDLNIYNNTEPLSIQRISRISSNLRDSKLMNTHDSMNLSNHSNEGNILSTHSKNDHLSICNTIGSLINEDQNFKQYSPENADFHKKSDKQTQLHSLSSHTVDNIFKDSHDVCLTVADLENDSNNPELKTLHLKKSHSNIIDDGELTDPLNVSMTSNSQVEMLLAQLNDVSLNRNVEDLKNIDTTEFVNKKSKKSSAYLSGFNKIDPESLKLSLNFQDSNNTSNTTLEPSSPISLHSKNLDNEILRNNTLPVMNAPPKKITIQPLHTVREKSLRKLKQNKTGLDTGDQLKCDNNTIPVSEESNDLHSSLSTPQIDDKKRYSVIKFPPGEGPCRSCGLVVSGKRSYSKAANELSGQWHRSCFRCIECNLPFSKTIPCYILDDQPYCQLHYHEANDSICRMCQGFIEGECLENDRGEIFHVDCLKCYLCHKIINEDYFLYNNELPLCGAHDVEQLSNGKLDTDE